MSTAEHITIKKAGPWLVALLPEETSKQLPSRGVVMVKGTLDDTPFKTVLEPDGRGSHWFRIDKLAPQYKEGDKVAVAVESTNEWVEPELPEDWQATLEKAPDKVQELWQNITPMARWDWLRWIQATNNPETRQKHLQVAVSKMSNGTRRPCCFNRNVCTYPEVSKGWKLL